MKQGSLTEWASRGSLRESQSWHPYKSVPNRDHRLEYSHNQTPWRTRTRLQSFLPSQDQSWQQVERQQAKHKLYTPLILNLNTLSSIIRKKSPLSLNQNAFFLKLWLNFICWIHVYFYVLNLDSCSSRMSNQSKIRFPSPSNPDSTLKRATKTLLLNELSNLKFAIYQTKTHPLISDSAFEWATSEALKSKNQKFNLMKELCTQGWSRTIPRLVESYEGALHPRSVKVNRR